MFMSPIILNISSCIVQIVESYIVPNIIMFSIASWCEQNPTLVDMSDCTVYRYIPFITALKYILAGHWIFSVL